MEVMYEFWFLVPLSRWTTLGGRDGGVWMWGSADAQRRGACVESSTMVVRMRKKQRFCVVGYWVW